MRIRIVERYQLADEHPCGPTVADDVMKREEDDVILSAGSHEGGSQQRVVREIERTAGLFGKQRLNGRLPFRFRQVAQVKNRKRHWLRLAHGPHGLLVDGGEVGAQHFVTSDYFTQASPQRGDIQWPSESHRSGNVVRGTLRIELLQKPETLLRKRERRRSRRLATRDGLGPRQLDALFE